MYMSKFMTYIWIYYVHVEYTMYIGDPHNVAAMTPSSKNRANPKSAVHDIQHTVISYQQWV